MEQTSSSDPFAEESSGGTARFVGGAEAMAVSYGIENCGNEAAVGTAVTASCSNLDTVNATHEFQTMKPSSGNKQPAANGRTEIPHSELVKMLYYLEGELQARDVVIAALRNERVKHLLNQLRTKRIQPNDPYAAIFRDKVALNGNLISREASTQAAQAEMEVRQIIEQQMEQQYQMVSKQRATHVRMVNILTESLENNQRMLQELEEEKRKHEHDTAQGDDITYGLEMERTKLKQELEDERSQVKKLEKDMKKLQETLEYERNRQKQIVLLLIAERKKILMKYIEEGKRSEDLAQILSEEKQRSDTIAEGLEEESKKSLRMEEELEKQTVSMDNERKNLLASLAKEELRVKELEQEITALRNENEALRKQHQHNSAAVANVASSANVAKTRTYNDESCATPLVNVAKIVQPTATVSSVPVSGPTTGIARSIVPGQNIRSGVAVAVASAPQMASTPSAIVATVNSSVQLNCDTTVGTVGVAAPPSPSPAKMQPTATIQRAPGGKYAALAAAASLDQTVSHPPHPVPIAVPPVIVPSAGVRSAPSPAGARGAPPPIPTKPIVPPKREPSLSRLGSVSGTSTSGANASVVNTSVVGASPSTAVSALSTSAANINANVKLN